MTDASTKTRPRKARIIIWAIIAAAIMAMILTVVIANVVNNNRQQTLVGDGPQLTRENSRHISQADDEKAVLVEFLDFECEACLAAKPFVDELEQEFGENLTITARYFPLPGHTNSMNAALAVEAAAQQGKFTQMLDLMYETQADWGEASESKADVFRGFAEDLDLDLAAYDAAITDPETKNRIELDVADGTALGVTGTPTFFLNDEEVLATTLDEFRTLVADSINGS